MLQPGPTVQRDRGGTFHPTRGVRSWLAALAFLEGRVPGRRRLRFDKPLLSSPLHRSSIAFHCSSHGSPAKRRTAGEFCSFHDHSRRVRVRAYLCNLLDQYMIQQMRFRNGARFSNCASATAAVQQLCLPRFSNCASATAAIQKLAQPFNDCA